MGTLLKAPFLLANRLLNLPGVGWLNGYKTIIGAVLVVASGLLHITIALISLYPQYAWLVTVKVALDSFIAQATHFLDVVGMSFLYTGVLGKAAKAVASID
jgi:hypothetical protein